MMMEEKQLNNELELSVFLLAILIQGEFDSEKINKIHKELLRYPYIEVFGFSYFFLQNWLNGYKQGRNFLKMLKRILRINTQP